MHRYAHLSRKTRRVRWRTARLPTQRRAVTWSRRGLLTSTRGEEKKLLDVDDHTSKAKRSMAWHGMA
eukprot:881470-Pyramimonas_sp.AAC.1